MVKLSLKSQLIIFLITFAIYLSIKDRDLAFLFSTAIAVISAVAIETFVFYFKEKKFLISDSSVISGLIVGFVLYSRQSPWLFSLASIIAICSKYLLRFDKRHIFNPAAFGVFLATVLFGATTAWKGTYLWYIILPFGIYFVYKIRKVEIILGYFLAFFSLFGMQALMQKINLLNIFGYLSYFYIFVMVVEPKTSPLNPAGKFLFGFGVCVLIFILTEAGAGFDVELFSLLIFNLFWSFLNKMKNLRVITKGGV